MLLLAATGGRLVTDTFEFLPLVHPVPGTRFHTLLAGCRYHDDASLLAVKVADQLMAKDALAAHARDELGISEISTARPVQAALTSAATFAVGAAMPLLMVLISPSNKLVPLVSVASLGFLALLGAVGAKAGGADIVKATARVTFWGALAMALTAGIGKLFGTVV